MRDSHTTTTSMSSSTHSLGSRHVQVEAMCPWTMMMEEYADAAVPTKNPTNSVTLTTPLRVPLRVTDVGEWLRYAKNEEGFKLLNIMVVQLDPAPWKLVAASLRHMLAHLPAGVTGEQHQALRDMMEAASRYHRTLCRHARADYEKSKANHPRQGMDKNVEEEKEDEEEVDMKEVAARIGAQLREFKNSEELMGGGLQKNALQSQSHEQPLSVMPFPSVTRHELLDQLSTRIERLHAVENMSLREIAQIGGMIEQAKGTAVENPKRKRAAAAVGGVRTVWDELAGLRSLPLSRCKDAVRMYHLARQVPNVLFTKLGYTTLVGHATRLLEYIAAAPREEQELWGYNHSSMY